MLNLSRTHSIPVLALILCAAFVTPFADLVAADEDLGSLVHGQAGYDEWAGCPCESCSSSCFSNCDRPSPCSCLDEACSPCGACDCCYGPLGKAYHWLIPDLSEKGRKSLADKHAPAGVMAEHVHGKGHWMLEYKLMSMYMDDNRAGTRTVSDANALTIGQALGTNFGATPTRMNMEMHMLHIMYGLTDEITLMAMPMWTSLTMDHLRNTPFPPNPPLAGMPFTTHNSGFDDLVLGFNWKFNEGPCHEWLLSLLCSIPTGEIDRRTRIPTGGLVAQELPYPMRLGSGTFDAMPAVTYKRYFSNGSMGLQFQADVPIGRNYENYRVGELFRANFWYSRLIKDWLALSYRIEGLWRMNYGGADPDLNPAIISTSRTDMRGGQWLNFGYGAMVLLRDGHLLNFEVVHPVYQNLDGIQLEQDWWFNLSWSKAF